MIELFYDFHIHSCLSPCGDEDMTPANIVGMAMIKGLQVIALTDHNSCKNCRAMEKLASSYGILFIPGMELTTREEVHVLCLFPDLENAMKFDAFVYEHLHQFPNHEEIFGKQLIVDEEDCVIGKEEALLIQSTDLAFDQVYESVTMYGGVMIPAHIDKNSHSLLYNLGFVPENSKFSCVEIFDVEKREELLVSHSYLEKCRILVDSDAHYLGDISEPKHTIAVKEANISAIFAYLRGE